MPGVDPRVPNPGPELWFNPEAFVDPPDFALGNAPRTHPSLYNPARQFHDLAVTKRVALSSSKSLEVLFEGFNFSNRANWDNPDPVIGSEGARNANAGKVIQSEGGRVIQLGLRFNF